MAVEEIKKIGYAIPIITSIILLAVISVIIIVTFQEVKPTQESIAVVNETNGALSPNKFIGGSLILNQRTYPRGNFLILDNTSVILMNDTNLTIGSKNYYPFPNGSIILANGATDKLNNAYVNATYKYNIEASSYYYNITKTGGNTFQNITKQMPLFGTIMILITIALIALGIFAFFGKKKKPL